MGLVDNMKDAAKIMQQIDNVELYQKIIESINEIYELQLENIKLKKEIETLKDIDDLSKKIQYIENSYWMQEDGPFCTNCWDVNKKLVRIHSANMAAGECPNCKSQVIFNKEKYSEMTKIQNENRKRQIASMKSSF